MGALQCSLQSPFILQWSVALGERESVAVWGLFCSLALVTRLRQTAEEEGAGGDWRELTVPPPSTGCTSEGTRSGNGKREKDWAVWALSPIVEQWPLQIPGIWTGSQPPGKKRARCPFKDALSLQRSEMPAQPAQPLPSSHFGVWSTGPCCPFQLVVRVPAVFEEGRAPGQKAPLKARVSDQAGAADVEGTQDLICFSKSASQGEVAPRKSGLGSKVRNDYWRRGRGQKETDYGIIAPRETWYFIPKSPGWPIHKSQEMGVGEERWGGKAESGGDSRKYRHVVRARAFLLQTGFQSCHLTRPGAPLVTFLTSVSL